MILICSKASVRLSSISESSKEKRSPARERSFCPKTSLNSWCMLRDLMISGLPAGPGAMHLSQQRLVRPKYVAGHRLHIPWKVIFLQTLRFSLTLSARETNDTRQPLAQNVSLVPRRERRKEKNIWKCAWNNRFWLDDLQKNPFLILSQKALSKMILFFQNLIWSLKKQLFKNLLFSFLYPSPSLPATRKQVDQQQICPILARFPQIDSHGNQTENAMKGKENTGNTF